MPVCCSGSPKHWVSKRASSIFFSRGSENPSTPPPHFFYKTPHLPSRLGKKNNGTGTFHGMGVGYWGKHSKESRQSRSSTDTRLEHGAWYCWWFRYPANQLRLVAYPVIYMVLYGRYDWMSRERFFCNCLIKTNSSLGILFILNLFQLLGIFCLLTPSIQSYSRMIGASNHRNETILCFGEPRSGRCNR